MGNTLEGQKALAPKPKKQKIVVTPDKPYYSSKELESGFKQTLLTDTIIHDDAGMPTTFGNLSPRAAALDIVSKGINLFRGPEGRRGHRLAKKLVKKTKVY